MSFLENHPCPSATVPDRLKFWGETSPYTPAFIFWGPSGREVLSRADVFNMSSKFASMLQALEVHPGDVVAIVLPNSPERVIVDFGIILAGAVSMNGQLLRADGEDLFESLSKAECTTVVINPEGKGWDLLEKISEKCERFDTHANICSKRLPSLKRIVFVRRSDRKSHFDNPISRNAQFKSNPRSLDDTCIIFTTSGSTGYSKLIPYTHRQLLFYGYTYCHILDLKNEMKHLVVTSIGWIAAYPASFMASGCTVVLVDMLTGDGQNNWSLTWESICKERIDTAFLVPLAAEGLFQERAKSDIHTTHSLTNTIICGQPLTKISLKYIGTLAKKLCIVYGATECGITTFAHIDDSNTDAFADFMSGFPLPGIKLKVVDEDDNEVPANARGVIVVQSPTVTPCYIGDKGATEKGFLLGGWFKTNDIGYIREDGCLFVEGRANDAIHHGLYILYPTWLEQQMAGCPGARHVAIVPVPDKILHHEICACVQRDVNSDIAITEDTVISYAKKKMIEEASPMSFIPKYVVFLFEFPQTFNGKTDRRGLSQRAAEILQLQE